MSDIKSYTTDYYKLLGVQPNASKQEISKAYRKIALQNHPDKTSNSERHKLFNKAVEAYEILSDDQKRKNYDMYGESNYNHFINSRDIFKRHFDIMKSHFDLFDNFFKNDFVNSSRMFNAFDQLNAFDQMHSNDQKDTFDQKDTDRSNYQSITKSERTSFINGKRNTIIEVIVNKNGKKENKTIKIDDNGNKRIDNF